MLVRALWLKTEPCWWLLLLYDTHEERERVTLYKLLCSTVREKGHVHAITLMIDLIS